MIRIGAMRGQARAACRPLSPAGGYALRAAVTVAIVLVVTAVFWPPASARANVSSAMPDFYAEPGLHPFRDQLADTANEFIDPFSGSLQLSTSIWVTITPHQRAKHADSSGGEHARGSDEQA